MERGDRDELARVHVYDPVHVEAMINDARRIRRELEARFRSASQRTAEARERLAALRATELSLGHALLEAEAARSACRAEAEAAAERLLAEAERDAAAVLAHARTTADQLRAAAAQVTGAAEAPAADGDEDGGQGTTPPGQVIDLSTDDVARHAANAVLRALARPAVVS